ncbi:serine hydrolase domain-containing protein [Streptomyces erythrochromogenes]|uniref:serine hydrolase domain-containing protein n=1 Tax=Streptomyces erythrochromogenes TaxID=285574 RepID=UPI0036601C57
MPSPDGPGCAAAVGKRGNVAWQEGRGTADLATGRAITSKTVFDMASNSKQFTADAVLLLAGRHRLALDDPLSDFVDNPPAWTRNVTLGDLMRHTSGIPDKTLVHQGDWEGFHSTFMSPDRNTAVTVVCNVDSPDHLHAANQLLDIWTT